MADGNGHHEGRLPNGRFNGLAGPGRPKGSRAAELRQSVLAGCTVKHIRDVMQSVFECAVAGDMTAAKLYLEYMIGKPKETIEVNTVDRSEIVRMAMINLGFASPEIVIDPIDGNESCSGGSTNGDG